MTDRPPAPTDDTQVGRRQRKKEELERALIDAAIDLFESQGLDDTTVEEIANAVDVSPRTFHRYFAYKEDVLFADAEARRRRIEHALDHRPRDEPILDSLRFVAHQLTSEFVASAGFERRRIEILRGHPRLAARRAHQSEMWSTTLTAFVAARHGSAVDDPLPELLGASTTTVTRIAVERWMDAPATDVAALVDRCFDELAHLAWAAAAADTVMPNTR